MRWIANSQSEVREALLAAFEGPRPLGAHQLRAWVMRRGRMRRRAPNVKKHFEEPAPRPTFTSTMCIYVTGMGWVIMKPIDDCQIFYKEIPMVDAVRQGYRIAIGEGPMPAPTGPNPGYKTGGKVIAGFKKGAQNKASAPGFKKQPMGKSC